MKKGEELTRENLGNLIRERGQRVLRKFGEVAISDVSDPKMLEVLRFVVGYWPDYFRPAFTSFCCEAVGGQPEAADDLSLMITLTSAGGGIHDDIVDKSDNKHFRKTVLGQYGLDIALLVGDLLILKGWVMARELFQKNLSHKKIAEIIAVFGHWTTDVCEAEFMEIQCRQNLETDLEQYQNILRKSMADTRACARLGAIMGGGSRTEIEALTGFASQLGLLHRLTDDLKDTLNVELNLADRIRFESVPLPILFAAKSSREKKAIVSKIIGTHKSKAIDHKNLFRMCMETEAFTYVCNEAGRTAKKALDALESLRSSSPKKILAFMVEDSLAEIHELSRLANLCYQHAFAC